MKNNKITLHLDLICLFYEFIMPGGLMQLITLSGRVYKGCHSGGCTPLHCRMHKRKTALRRISDETGNRFSDLPAEIVEMMCDALESLEAADAPIF
jgi:hypothetical protein